MNRFSGPAEKSPGQERYLPTSIHETFCHIPVKLHRVNHYKYHKNPFYTDDHFGSEMN